MTNLLMEAALEYASMGWPVLPLKPRDKRPLTTHGLVDATTYIQTVGKWWLQWPDANIGLRTGIKFDVLDIDGPKGLESIRTFGYRHNGPIAKTGKGYHLLFDVTGARNSAAMLPGLDFRGDGGYIVAPPSIHPLGHAYEWTTEPFTHVLPEAPEWLIDLILPKPPELNARALLYPNRAVETMTSRLSIEVELERLGVQLKRLGSRRVGKCPFHEDDTPSLVIYSNDTFFCFGCGAWGDALNVANYRLHGALR